MPPSTPPALTDVHAHLVPSGYLRYLEGRSEHPAAEAQLPWLTPFGGYGAAMLVAAMDGAGVDAAWVSYPPPGDVAQNPETVAQEARELNARLSDEAEKYPARLQAVPLLPLGFPPAALEVAKTLAAAPAAMVYLRPVGPQPDDRDFWPVLEQLEAHGTPLFLHPGVEPLTPLADVWGLASAVSAPVATTLAVARLILSGTLDAFPELTIILPHLGGVLPFLLSRLEDQTSGRAHHPFRDYLAERVLLDSACFDRQAMSCARSSLPQTRILFGSDTPFRGPLTRALNIYAPAAEGVESGI